MGKEEQSLSPGRQLGERQRVALAAATGYRCALIRRNRSALSVHLQLFSLLSRGKVDSGWPMKRILIINGSYHETGDIAFLVDRFAAGVREAGRGAEIEIVHLLDLRMEYCRGCWICGNPENIGKPIGDCPIEDDVRALLEKSLACDVLVYATPVYEMGPTAVMKKFLERNLPVVGGIGIAGFKGRQPARKGKSGAVILSSGAPYPVNLLLGFTRYPKRILSLFCRFHGCGKTVLLPAGGLGGSARLRLSWGQKAYKQGRRLTA
jgi:putative NADPH-quinone reductase